MGYSFVNWNVYFNGLGSSYFLDWMILLYSCGMTLNKQKCTFCNFFHTFRLHRRLGGNLATTTGQNGAVRFIFNLTGSPFGFGKKRLLIIGLKMREKFFFQIVEYIFRRKWPLLLFITVFSQIAHSLVDNGRQFHWLLGSLGLFRFHC